MPRLKTKLSVKNKLRPSLRLALSGLILFSFLSIFVGIYFYFSNSKDASAGKHSPAGGFNWRKKITLNKLLNSANDTLYDFPVLIKMSDMEFRHIDFGGKIFNRSNPEIIFSSIDGKTFIPAEVDYYDPQTGNIHVWVVFDTISSPNMELYTYYSKPDHDNFLQKDIWNNNFIGLWHFDDRVPSGIRDTKAPSYSGTFSTNGLIGKARKFNANAKNYASFDYGDYLNPEGDFSISVWVFPAENGKEQTILSSLGKEPGGYRLFIDKNGIPGFDFFESGSAMSGKQLLSAGSRLISGQWNLISAVYSPSDEKITISVNGLSEKHAKASGIIAKSKSALQLGRKLFDDESYFNGFMDELRIYSKPFNKSRILAEYNQYKNPYPLLVGKGEELILDESTIADNKVNYRNKLLPTASGINISDKLQEKIINEVKPKPVLKDLDFASVRLKYIRNVSEKNREGK